MPFKPIIMRSLLEFEAVQVTPENMAELAQWSRGEIKENGRGKFIAIHQPRTKNPRHGMGFVGDWVLRAGNGFKIYLDDAFMKSFINVDQFDRESHIAEIINDALLQQDANTFHGQSGQHRLLAGRTAKKINDMYKRVFTNQ